MPGINIPAGKRVIGGNLIHNPHAASQPINSRRFEYLFEQWNWDGFIRPQIDYMIGDLGMNCLRIIGAHWGVSSGRLNAAQYTARMVQIAEYLASKGCYWYPGGDSARTEADYSTPAAQQALLYAAYLKPLQQIGNSIGFDIVQEGDTGSFTYQYMSDVIAGIKAAGVTMPLTYSTSEAITASGATWLNSRMALFDYLDLHIYNFTANPDYIDYYLLNSTKEIIVGETGKNQKALTSEGGGSPGEVVADLARIYRIGLSGHPRVRGILHWCGGDQDTATSFPSDPASRQFGAYDTNTSPGTWIARPHLTQFLRRQTGGSVYRCNNP